MLLHDHKPIVMGVLETKVRRDNQAKIMGSLCPGWGVTDNYSHFSGGRIWVIWDPNMCNITMYKCTYQLVHCKLETKGGKVMRISFIYADNSKGRRKDLWEDLKKIGRLSRDPWLALGDFNSILISSKKGGGIG